MWDSAARITIRAAQSAQAARGEPHLACPLSRTSRLIEDLEKFRRVSLAILEHELLEKETKLRHDHGSQFVSHAFQDELKTLGIESRPSLVRQPEGNGCVGRFIRTLKEQLLWLHRFRTIAELVRALRDFAHRFNNHWIIGWIGYRTPAAPRRILLGEAA